MDPAPPRRDFPVPDPPVRDLPSPNHDARPGDGTVDTLVLHYTGMADAAAAAARLRDPASKVSCHYLVDEDGAVLRLVPESRRAWHAGVSCWRGRPRLNDRSIGIEIVNPGHEFGYRPFPALQMAAVCDLCLAVLARHPIAARDVVGHADVAPDRKRDPGELFDWAGLAANGVGLWPADGAGPAPGPDLEAAAEGLPRWAVLATPPVPSGAGLLADPAALPRAVRLLAAIGYPVEWADPAPALIAFQRRFRPARVDGVADAGTLARLAAVAALCGEAPSSPG